MPSANKTQYLKLNQWAASDRPMRNDFNSDNVLLDTAVGAHINNADIHVTAEERKFLSDRQITYSYTGDGEESRALTVTEAFRLIMIFAKDKPFGGSDGVYSAVGYLGLGSSSGLTLSASGTGFTVAQGNGLSLNESGVQYRVVMIK